MSHEKIEHLINFIFLSTGTVGVATLTFWQDIDLAMSIFLKCTSLITFICYLLINQDAIHKGFIKRKNIICKYFK